MRTVGMIFPESEKTPETFPCPHCDKVFKSAAALKTHCKKEHPEAFDTTDKSEQ